VHRQPVHMTLPVLLQEGQPARVAASMPLPMQLPQVR
jgi:hypothetical protein